MARFLVPSTDGPFIIGPLIRIERAKYLFVHWMGRESSLGRRCCLLLALLHSSQMFGKRHPNTFFFNSPLNTPPSLITDTARGCLSPTVDRQMAVEENKQTVRLQNPIGAHDLPRSAVTLTCRHFGTIATRTLRFPKRHEVTDNSDAITAPSAAADGWEWVKGWVRDIGGG